METKIEKIILKSEKGETFEIIGDKLDIFLDICSIDFKKNFIHNLLNNKKIRGKIIKILLFGILRKVLGSFPAISERNLVKSVDKNWRLKKVLLMEVFFLGGKKISFFLGEKIHLLNLMGDFVGIVVKNQYNINSDLIRGKVVFDCGSHNGVFSIYSSIFSPSRIYSFEPVRNTYEILKKNVELNRLQKKMVLTNSAVGEKNEEGKIFFDKIADGSASLNKKMSHYENVKIISLDWFSKFNKVGKVGIIKMDIEGNEKEALNGAKRIISKYKPILTFSAYHKPSDKVILPKIVKKIRGDYKIKLIDRFEEDFYCE
jgi:FkbM family methyltransferase